MLHVKFVHKKPEKKKYICEICKIEFNSSSNLCEHRKARHAEEKREKCEICDKEIKAGPSMRIHINNHSKDKVECHLCNKTVYNKATLKTHIQNVHSETKDHKCKVCSKAFTSKDYLTEVVALSVAERSVHLG